MPEQDEEVEQWQVREIIEQYRIRSRQLRDMAGQPGRSKKEISTLLGDAAELSDRADKLEATLDSKPARRVRYADDFDDEQVDGKSQAGKPRTSVPRDPRTGRFVNTYRY